MGAAAGAVVTGGRPGRCRAVLGFSRLGRAPDGAAARAWWAKVVLASCRDRPVGRLVDAALRRHVAAAAAGQRPEQPVLGRLRASTWPQGRGLAIVVTSLGLVVLIGVRGGGGGPGRPSPRACWRPSSCSARSSTRCSSSRSSTASTRCPTATCDRRSSSSPTRRACASTTSWSPTRRGVRRPSTPTSAASAAPDGWSSTTSWSRPAARRGALGGRARAGPRRAPRRGHRYGAGRRRCGAGVGLLALLVTAGPGRRRVSLADPRVVPLVLALQRWATLVASPVQNGISRQIETRADVDALHDDRRRGLRSSSMQRTLALRSLSDPTPPAWLQWWWGSHPTTLERVAIARAVDPGREHDRIATTRSCAKAGRVEPRAPGSVRTSAGTAE